MELHQLRYVCAVAETGSFSRAAERCQIAQPSLSQQVLKLEEELGAKLFDRLGRGIRLTESGRAFLPHARAILDQVDVARASVASNSADVRGSVTLGAIPTVAPYLIPRYTAAFTKRFPDARLRIVEETTPVLIEGLRDLSIDFALLALPLRQRILNCSPSGPNAFWPLCRKSIRWPRTILFLWRSCGANLSSCCGTATAFEISVSRFAAARMSIRTSRLKAANSAAS